MGEETAGCGTAALVVSLAALSVVVVAARAKGSGEERLLVCDCSFRQSDQSKKKFRLHGKDIRQKGCRFHIFLPFKLQKNFAGNGERPNQSVRGY